MTIRTLGNRIAVTRIAAEKTTASGILLNSTGEPDRARVEVIGPDVEDVQVGDILLVNWNEASKVNDGIDEYYVIPVTAAIWVFEE